MEKIEKILEKLDGVAIGLEYSNMKKSVEIVRDCIKEIRASKEFNFLRKSYSLATKNSSVKRK